MRCWLSALIVLSLISLARAVSCSLEKKLASSLRSAFKKYPKDAPKFVRAVFHDSVDYKNLLEKRGGWKEIRGYTGGVDGCLYAPLNSMGGGAAAMLQEETNHTAAARLASTLGIGEETWASMLELQDSTSSRGGKGS